MNYPGAKGKSGHLQHILANIPKCDLFIEVFAGSAVLSNYIARECGASVATNDYDGSLKTMYHLHYKDLVAKYDYAGHGSRFFYFDPPYMMETRSWKGKLYKHDWNDQDHREFLSVVLAVKNNCMISHYPCPLYDQTLSEWRQYRYKAMTRAGLREECLYMNYPPPSILLTPWTVGRNRTHRQQVKRKLLALQLKIAALDPAEKAAMFTYLKGLIDGQQ